MANITIFKIDDKTCRVLIEKQAKTVFHCEPDRLINTLHEKDGPVYTDCEMREFGLERDGKPSHYISIRLSKNNYPKDFKNGSPYVKVEYHGQGYSGTINCDSKEDIDSAVNSAKAYIIKERDVPLISGEAVKRIKKFLNHKSGKKYLLSAYGKV